MQTINSKVHMQKFNSPRLHLIPIKLRCSGEKLGGPVQATALIAASRRLFVCGAAATLCMDVVFPSILKKIRAYGLQKLYLPLWNSSFAFPLRNSTRGNLAKFRSSGRAAKAINDEQG